MCVPFSLPVFSSCDRVRAHCASQACDPRVYSARACCARASCVPHVRFTCAQAPYVWMRCARAISGVRGRDAKSEVTIDLSLPVRAVVLKTALTVNMSDAVLGQGDTSPYLAARQHGLCAGLDKISALLEIKYMPYHLQVNIPCFYICMALHGNVLLGVYAGRLFCYTIGTLL